MKTSTASPASTQPATPGSKSRFRGGASVLAIAGLAVTGALGIMGYRALINCSSCTAGESAQAAALAAPAEHTHAADGGCCPLHNKADAIGPETAANTGAATTDCDGHGDADHEHGDGCDHTDQKPGEAKPGETKPSETKPATQPTKPTPASGTPTP